MTIIEEITQYINDVTPIINSFNFNQYSSKVCNIIYQNNSLQITCLFRKIGKGRGICGELFSWSGVLQKASRSLVKKIQFFSNRSHWWCT